MNFKVKTVGALQCRGSLCSEKSKWQTYFIQILDGALQQYACSGAVDASAQGGKHAQPKKGEKVAAEVSRGHLLAYIPLSQASIDEVSKKDKPTTEHAFALVLGAEKGAKKSSSDKASWRTLFCAESKQQLEKWLAAVKANIFIARPNIFGTTMRDALLKSNRFVPRIVTVLCGVILNNLGSEPLLPQAVDSKQIDELIAIFDKGEPLPPSLFEPKQNSLALAVLRTYFDSLTENFLPASFLQLITSMAMNASAPQVRQALQTLDLDARVVLAYLITFFNDLEVKSKKSGEVMNYLSSVVIVKKDSPPSSTELAQAVSTLSMLMQHVAVFSGEIPYFESYLFDSTQELRTNNSRRHCVTDAEKAQLMQHLQRYDEDSEEMWDKLSLWLVHVTPPGGKSDIEPRLLVIDKTRVYLFCQGGKLDLTFHFLDIKEVFSAHANILKLNLTTMKQHDSQYVITPICYSEFSIDDILTKLLRELNQNFVGKSQANRFPLSISPPDRYSKIEKSLGDIDVISNCCGLVQTYTAVCDRDQDIHIIPDIVEDLTSYFSTHSIKEFHLSDFMKSMDKYPNTDFVALMTAMQYNTWFRTLLCDGHAIGTEGLMQIAEIVAKNQTLTTLSLKNTNAKAAGINALFSAMLANPLLGITDLSLSGNSLDNVDALCKCLSQSLGRLVRLDIGSTQLGKKALGDVLAVMARSEIRYHMQDLDLAHNKISDQGARDLGIFLGGCNALTSLAMGNEGLNFALLNEGLNFNSVATLRSLDISKMKVKPSQESELIAFVRALTGLTSLNVAQTDISSKALQGMVTAHLESLNVSDIALGNNGIEQLVHSLMSFGRISLRSLYVSRCFGLKVVHRKEAVKALAALVNGTNLALLHVKGGGKNQLRVDLLDLLVPLYANTTLLELDIQGHQGGDRLANSVAKLMQHNRTLRTLRVDSNGVSLKGLRLYKLGLERNGSLVHFQAPAVDLGALIKKAPKEEQSALTARATDLISRLNRITCENAFRSKFVPGGELARDDDRATVTAEGSTDSATLRPDEFVNIFSGRRKKGGTASPVLSSATAKDAGGTRREKKDPVWGKVSGHGTLRVSKREKRPDFKTGDGPSNSSGSGTMRERDLLRERDRVLAESGTSSLRSADSSPSQLAGGKGDGKIEKNSSNSFTSPLKQNIAFRTFNARMLADHAKNYAASLEEDEGKSASASHNETRKEDEKSDIERSDTNSEASTQVSTPRQAYSESNEQSKLDEVFGLEEDTSTCAIFNAPAPDNNATSLALSRNWNEEYYRRLNTESSNASSSMSGGNGQLQFVSHEESLAGVRPLVEEFARHCLATASALFQTREHELTRERSLQKGFNHNGLTFKLAKDYYLPDRRRWFYGHTQRDDEAAGKCARNQYRAWQLVHRTLIAQQQHVTFSPPVTPSSTSSLPVSSSSSPPLRQMPLRVPLCALVNVSGYWVTVTARSLEGQAISTTAAFRNDLFSHSMMQLCRELNLASFTLTDAATGLKDIMHGSADLDIFTLDSHYYISNLVHLLPPDATRASPSLHQVLRPTYVASFTSPLCGHAFTARMKNVQQYEKLHASVMTASTKLLLDAVPALASHLNSLSDVAPLTPILHAQGVNVRHVGRARSLVQSHWQAAILEECCYRTVKNLGREFLRNSPEELAAFLQMLVAPPCATITLPGHSNTQEVALASATTLIAASPLPVIWPSFYLEVTVIGSLLDGYSIGLSTSPASVTCDEESLVSITSSSKPTIGIHINYAQRQYEVLKATNQGLRVVVTRLKDSEIASPLYLVLKNQSSVTYSLNLGSKPFFFPIATYGLKNFSLVPGNFQSSVGAQFWRESKATSSFMSASSSSGGTNTTVSSGALSIKQQLKTRFPQLLTTEELERHVDLRDHVNVSRVCERACQALGLPDETVRAIVANESHVWRDTKALVASLSPIVVNIETSPASVIVNLRAQFYDRNRLFNANSPTDNNNGSKQSTNHSSLPPAYRTRHNTINPIAVADMSTCVEAMHAGTSGWRSSSGQGHFHALDYYTWSRLLLLLFAHSPEAGRQSKHLSQSNKQANQAIAESARNIEAHYATYHDSILLLGILEALCADPSKPGLDPYIVAGFTKRYQAHAIPPIPTSRGNSPGQSSNTLPISPRSAAKGSVFSLFGGDISNTASAEPTTSKDGSASTNGSSLSHSAKATQSAKSLTRLAFGAIACDLSFLFRSLSVLPAGEAMLRHVVNLLKELFALHPTLRTSAYFFISQCLYNRESLARGWESLLDRKEVNQAVVYLETNHNGTCAHLVESLLLPPDENMIRSLAAIDPSLIPKPSSDDLASASQRNASNSSSGVLGRHSPIHSPISPGRSPRNSFHRMPNSASNASSPSSNALLSMLNSSIGGDEQGELFGKSPRSRRRSSAQAEGAYSYRKEKGVTLGSSGSGTYNSPYSGSPLNRSTDDQESDSTDAGGLPSPTSTEKKFRRDRDRDRKDANASPAIKVSDPGTDLKPKKKRPEDDHARDTL